MGLDGSGAKSTGCSSRRPGFNSQYPHGILQLSVTQISGDPTCTWCTDTHTGRIPIPIK